MERVQIMFDQLVAGALLKFGKLDSVDITLLVEDISSFADVVYNDSECVDQYFVMSNGNVILNNSYVNQIYKRLNNTFLERMQGDMVKKYLEDLNMEEFVLRKIKLLGEGFVPRDDLIHSFSILQIHELINLYQKGYIMDYWHEECIYDDYKAVKLTKRGELSLFLYDNKKEIDEFSKLLRSKGYDETLVQAFLITQNLERRSADVLTIENFIIFCNEFDRCPYIDKAGKRNVRTKRSYSNI